MKWRKVRKWRAWPWARRGVEGISPLHSMLVVTSGATLDTPLSVAPGQAGNTRVPGSVEYSTVLLLHVLTCTWTRHTETRAYLHLDNIHNTNIYAGSVLRMHPLFISTTADFFTKSMLSRLTVSDNTREITFLVVEGQGALQSMREHYGGAVRYIISVCAGIFI